MHTANMANICLDHTLFPDNEEHTLADLNTLGTIMLQIMDETRDTLKSPAVSCSAEATSFPTPDERSDVSLPDFQSGSFTKGLLAQKSLERRAETLTPPCTLADFLVSKEVYDERRTPRGGLQMHDDLALGGGQLFLK